MKARREVAVRVIASVNTFVIAMYNEASAPLLQ
jgi:hypothetical protein